MAAAAFGLLRLGLNENGRPALFLEEPPPPPPPSVPQHRKVQQRKTGNRRNGAKLGDDSSGRRSKGSQLPASLITAAEKGAGKATPGIKPVPTKSQRNVVRNSAGGGGGGGGGRNVGGGSNKYGRNHESSLSNNKKNTVQAESLPTIKETLREGKQSPAPIASKVMLERDGKVSHSSVSESVKHVSHSPIASNSNSVKSITGVSANGTANFASYSNNPTTNLTESSPSHISGVASRDNGVIIDAGHTTASSSSPTAPAFESLAEKKRRQWNEERRQAELFLNQEKQKANVSLNFPTPTAMRTSVLMADATPVQETRQYQQQQQQLKLQQQPQQQQKQQLSMQEQQPQVQGLDAKLPPRPRNEGNGLVKTPPYPAQVHPPSPPQSSSPSSPLAPAAMRSSIAIGDSSPNKDLESRIKDDKEKQRLKWLQDLEEQKRLMEERKRQEKERDRAEGAAAAAAVVASRKGGGGGGGGGGEEIW